MIFHYKKRAEANNAQRGKKGKQLRTEGDYGKRAEDWEEEESEGGGRELREEE